MRHISKGTEEKMMKKGNRYKGGRKDSGKDMSGGGRGSASNKEYHHPTKGKHHPASLSHI